VSLSGSAHEKLPFSHISLSTIAVEGQLGELKVIMNALVELETRHVMAVQQ